MSKIDKTELELKCVVTRLVNLSEGSEQKQVN
jgi:hypothetical protein